MLHTFVIRLIDNILIAFRYLFKFDNDKHDYLCSKNKGTPTLVLTKLVLVFVMDINTTFDINTLECLFDKKQSSACNIIPEALRSDA